MLKLNKMKEYLELVVSDMEISDYYDYVQAIDILDNPEHCEPWFYDSVMQNIVDLYNKYTKPF